MLYIRCMSLYQKSKLIYYAWTPCGSPGPEENAESDAFRSQMKFFLNPTTTPVYLMGMTNKIPSIFDVVGVSLLMRVNHLLIYCGITCSWIFLIFFLFNFEVFRSTKRWFTLSFSSYSCNYLPIDFSLLQFGCMWNSWSCILAHDLIIVLVSSCDMSIVWVQAPSKTSS